MSNASVARSEGIKLFISAAQRRAASTVITLGAGAGAVLGSVVVFTAMLFSANFELLPLVMGLAALVGLVAGAVVAPLAGYTLLRTVPLGLAIGWTGVGTVAGLLAGAATQALEMLMVAPLAGFGISAVALSVFQRLRWPLGDRWSLLWATLLLLVAGLGVGHLEHRRVIQSTLRIPTLPGSLRVRTCSTEGSFMDPQTTCHLSFSPADLPSLVAGRPFTRADEVYRDFGAILRVAPSGDRAVLIW